AQHREAQHGVAHATQICLSHTSSYIATHRRPSPALFRVSHKQRRLPTALCVTAIVITLPPSCCRHHVAAITAISSSPTRSTTESVPNAAIAFLYPFYPRFGCSPAVPERS